MEITDIYVAVSGGKGSSVGYGTVTFDDILKVRFNIMKTKSDGRLFVNWPSQKGSDDKYYNQVSFVIDENDENPYAAKNSIEDPILKEFNKVLGTPSTKEAPKDAEPEPTPEPQKQKKVGLKFAPMQKG